MATAHWIGCQRKSHALAASRILKSIPFPRILQPVSRRTHLRSSAMNSPALITSWLKPFFNVVNHALANSNEELDKKADEIMKILSFNVEEIYHQEKVLLSAELKDVNSQRTIPDEALVQGSQSVMQSVFGVAGERASWAHVKSLFIDDVYNQWTAELSKAIYEFANR